MPTEPSEKIRDELLRITGFPYNYRHTLAIAPKYDSQIPDSELADLYQKDLQTLRAFEGQPATSAFFQRAAQLLGEKKKAEKDSVDFSNIQALAKTNFERSIAISFTIAKH